MDTSISKTIINMNGMQYLCHITGIEQDRELVIFLIWLSRKYWS